MLRLSLLLVVASVVSLSAGAVAAADVFESPVPAESTAPAESAESAESTAPAESAESAESTAPAESAESAESTAPAESAESAESTAPAESTASAPAFEGKLLRRSTPDVPLFVGPATLELSGKDGAYRWRDVRFGAQEVLVEIDTGGDACLAHLRLVEDGKPLVDEWFELSGPAETTLEIDYASARLRVDTDCPAWTMSFVPLEDPELPYTVRNTWYPVRGRTIDALATEVQHIDGKWAAYTEWFTSWEYSVEEGDLLCLAADGETQLSATIEFPNWMRPTTADPALVAEWRRYTDSLTTHELGHVTIALQGADAIDDRLDEGFSADTCVQVADDADARSNQILERFNRESARYDEATGHGSSQGVKLK